MTCNYKASQHKIFTKLKKNKNNKKTDLNYKNLNNEKTMLI